MKLVEIIYSTSKIASISDFQNNLDNIIELSKEDVFRIVSLKNIFFFDFDFTFSEAVKVLKNQLEKKHLKGIQRFYNFKKIENATKWIISRIINNMINITTDPRLRKYIDFDKVFTYYHLLLDKNETLEFCN